MAWSDLRLLVVDTTVELVRRHVRQHPDHTLYVIGLHDVYREVDGVITMPVVGVNSVEAYAEDHPEPDDGLGFWGARWDPARWRWPQISSFDPQLVVAERQLARLAEQGSRERWIRTEQRFWTEMAQACRDVHTMLEGYRGLTEDVVVLLHDRAGGPKLARRAMGDSAFRRAFPEQAIRKRERRRVASMPVDEQIDHLVERLGETDSAGLDPAEATERLRRIGRPAVPVLLMHLRDADVGWTVAMLLGQIGEADDQSDDDVLDALRQEVLGSRLASQRAWSASALALLGDGAFLVERADELPVSVVTTGLTAPLSAYRDECLRPPPLDYAVVESVLAGGGELATAVAAELDPRHGVCTISSAEVDRALDALDSAFGVVRAHAATVLDAPHLSRSSTPRVVEALTRRLTDDDTAVRHAAARALRSWTSSPTSPRRTRSLGQLSR